jgi:hypothetical protein
MVGDVCARGKIQSPRQAWLVPCAELRSLRTGKATLCLALCLMGPTSPETPLATGLAGSPVQLGPGHCPPLSIHIELAIPNQGFWDHDLLGL